MQDKPMIGALLRFSWQRVMRRMLERTQEMGFTDLQPAYMVVFLYPGPEGMSPGALAERCSMTKQAMNQLLHRLEEIGYLTREVDVLDHRARVIHLSEKGKQAVIIARHLAAGLEQEWAERLGHDRFIELKTTLQEIQSFDEPDTIKKSDS